MNDAMMHSTPVRVRCISPCNFVNDPDYNKVCPKFGYFKKK